MKYGKYRKVFPFHREVDAVSTESFQANLVGTTAHFAKKFTLVTRPPQSPNHLASKVASQPGTFTLVVRDSFEEFQFGLGRENEAHFHPKRCFISASTCSQGIPALGFFSNSARRRS